MPFLVPLVLVPLACTDPGALALPGQDPGSGASTDRLEYRGEPRALGPDAPLVGAWIPDLAFEAASGGERLLSEAAGPRGLVIALRDPDCPLSKRYGPRLEELADALPARGFGFLVANTLSRASAEADPLAEALGERYALDPDEELARALRATTTTEVFVLDAARTLRYRGMIDDQYGLGFAKPAPEHRWLERALAALEAGEPVQAPATQAQGCLFRYDDGDVAATGAPVTWHERVSRVLQAKCQACHRDGGVAPFALETLEQVKERAGMVEYVLQEGVMPPWKAEQGTGPWANDISLTPAEREDVLAWIAGGMPEGDAAHAPLPRAWTPGWTIGEPDLVLEIPEPIEVPAEGVVLYQYVYVRTGIPEDRWVKAVEIRPTAGEVVHHVLVFLEDPEVREAARRGDDEAGRREQFGSRGFFASAAPGQAGLVYPSGTGKLLPANAWLKFQLHYTPNGTATTDRTRIGFVFGDGPPPVEIHTAAAVNEDFAIPPKAFDHEVTASYRFPEDARILSLLPHTHLRGIRFLYELVPPGGGAPEPLLHVPFYDFDWQWNYELANPRFVPKGTELRAHAWYDNSEYNPANPDPEAWVRFGEQTFEEMMIGYVNWVPAGGA